MADYRLYFLDDDRRIKSAVEFRCDDDAEATIKAKTYRDGRDLELWAGVRMVATLPKLDECAPSSTPNPDQ